MLRSVALVKGRSMKEIQDTEMELVLLTSTRIQLAKAHLVIATAEPSLPAAETNNDMAPFPRAISQLTGDRVVTLGHFHQGRGSVWF